MTLGPPTRKYILFVYLFQQSVTESCTILSPRYKSNEGPAFVAMVKLQTNCKQMNTGNFQQFPQRSHNSFIHCSVILFSYLLPSMFSACQESEVKNRESVSQSCLTLCDPKDCSPPASSVHGILQARILEWVTIPFSRASSQPRNQTQVSCIAGGFFTS